MHAPKRRAMARSLAVLTLALALLPAVAGERLALVIGNGAYRHLRPLENPPNDALALATRLTKLGFTLVGSDGQNAAGPALDLDDAAISKTIRAFGQRAKGAEIALLFYAGHGMQMAGHPYLLPVNVPSDDLELLRRRSLTLEEVLKPLDGQAALTVAIFDACREIPELNAAVAAATRDSGYGPSAYRGLARVQGQGISRIVAYSGAEGQLVADGSGHHSPYSTVLLEHLDRPEPVESLLQRVAWQFARRYGGQNPEVLIQGPEPGRFYLRPPGPAVVGLTVPPVPVAVVPELIPIPAGCFQMGSPAGEAQRDSDERPHQVCVDAFAIGKYEVTFEEFDRFARASGRRLPTDEGWGRGRRPAINVDWQDATAYTEWLSAQTGGAYRLPTEAEWEYAARAGTTGPFWTGPCLHTDQANYDGNLDYGHCGSKTMVYRKQTLPVGSLKPNPWGLYDVAGNVWEWICSGYDGTYGGGEKICSSKNDAMSARVLRGGSWNSPPRNARAAIRYGYQPENRSGTLGFRLARTLSP